MSEINEKPRRKNTGRKVLIGFLCILVLVFAGLRFAGGSQVKRHVEGIRQRGLPASALELDAWYKRVPASENAALVFLEASRLHVLPPGKKNLNEMPFKPAEPISPGFAEAIERYVSANGEALEKMGEADGLQASRYPIDTSRGAATLLPHLAPVKQLAQLSKWAAIQRARENKGDEAVRILKNGFALAKSLEPEPVMISDLVRIASLTLLLQGVEQVLFETDLTEAQLAQLSEWTIAAESSGTNALFRSIAGERAFGLTSMDISYREFSQFSIWAGGAASSSSFEELAKAALFGTRRVLGMQARDKAFYLDTMAEWERAVRLDYPAMLRESERVNEEAMTQMGEHPIRYLISRLLLPSMGNYAKKEVMLVARLRCARTALAIERYRAKHSGKLPNLAELFPDFLSELPRDPADNEPLEYRKSDGQGYKIIAVTSTGTMNEGRKPTNHLEIGFTVVR